MSAAANGSITLQGRSGKTYIIDFYSPDAAATLLTFNANGSATSTSPNQFRVPETCLITDVSIATGTANYGVALNVDNASLNGGVLRWANFLNTLSHRPTLRIPVNAGSFLGGVTI